MFIIANGREPPLVIHQILQAWEAVNKMISKESNQALTKRKVNRQRYNKVNINY
jgi:hypothetical protein